mmetsp:Transcript_28166/g.79999  ORF Transcript_28166/g.79999 Transcript_28166/m.79999 type:complete len:205 (+) Transcript_28166:1510-2124(+)
MSMWQTVIAGVSRTSPVSFLKAKPKTAIFFPVTVLKRLEMIRLAKVDFWCSFMSTTCCQYWATSLSPSDSQMYTRLRMSFWKQEPPKPTEAPKNFGPILESLPMARETSATSAPVFSQSWEMELMLLTRWASIALATNFDSSELHKFVVKILSRGTQFAYTSTKTCAAARPSDVVGPPMRTRSGAERSFIAVPSARNSGLERIQ